MDAEREFEAWQTTTKEFEALRPLRVSDRLS